MPQPRVPTAIQEAKGSYLKHPERKRARANEPKPTGALGGPPSDFDKEHKAVWQEHCSKMPKGVASNWDETAFEVMICLIVNCRRRRRSNMPQVVGEIAQMNKLFVQFGMTPADRSRVSAVPDKQQSNPWEEFSNPTTQ